jgi:plasmid stabilization system protein ParE
MRVVVTPNARESLLDISDYLRGFSAGAEKRVLRRITSRFRQIAAFPESGRVVPEFGERSVRELIDGDYRI